MKGFEYITDVAEFGSLLKSLNRVAEIGLDIEASSLHPQEATFLLLQLEVNDLIYIIDARKIGKKNLTYLIELIKASNLTCIGHNLKYDIKVLYHNTGVILTNIYDTMIGEVLINQGIGSPYYGYVDLVFEYFDVELSKEVRDTFIDFDGEITENQLTYSALDVKYLRVIKETQLRILGRQKQLRVVDLEMKVTPILAKMEYDGVLVDKDLWLENIVIAKKESTRLREEILDTVINTLDKMEFENTFKVAEALVIPVKTKKLRLELESIAYPFGKTWVRNNFNVNSPYQLLKLFFMLGIYLPDTDAKTLEKVEEDHEIIKKVLIYREHKKRLTTYGESFITHIDKTTGRIHTNFTQLKHTGRLGSSGPNLQNIPVLEGYRKSFIARKGYKIITADYNQAELRYMGAISKETEIINAYINNEDLHKKTGGFLFNKSIEDVSKDERQHGKNINFGTIYLITPWGMRRNWGIPLETGEEFLRNFFKGYPILDIFLKQLGDIVCENYYSTTLLGRKRFFEKKQFYVDHIERDKHLSAMRREGVNHSVQGGSADIIKIAMCGIFYTSPWTYDELRILLQEHDELVLEVKDEIAEEAGEFIINCMEEAERPFLGEIPARVDIIIKDHWSKG